MLFAVIAITAWSDGAIIDVVSPAELRQALSSATAGTTIRMAPGVYTGNWIVRDRVRLVGDVGTVLEGAGDGTVLTLQGADITVEELVIRHSGRRNTSEDAGIKATGARIVISDVTVLDTLFGVVIEQCRGCVLDRATVIGVPGDMAQGDGIKLWEAHGSTVTNCVVEHSRDVVVWYSRNVRLTGNEVRSSRYGTHFMYAHDVSVSDGRFTGNVVGVFVMYSKRVRIDRTLIGGARGAAGMGVGVKESEDVSLTASAIVANTTGLYFDRAPRIESEPVSVTSCTIALNGVGVRLHSSQRGILLSGNDFAGNTSALEVDGGGSALGLEVAGNYWSDYEGFDLDGDGAGDVAFEVKALSRVWTDDTPALAFFKESVAMQAIDVIAQALPIVAARLLVRDPTPRMQRRLEALR